MSFMSGVRKSAGFTLVEMAVVMTISGFILVALTSVYSAYLNERQSENVREKQGTVRASISAFAGQFVNAGGARYPCPAAINVPFNDPRAGREDCTWADPSHPIGTCDPATGICKVAGRSTDLYPNGEVLIGAIPYKDIKEGIESKMCVRTSNPTEIVDCSDTTIPHTIVELCVSTITGNNIPCTDPNSRKVNKAAFTSIAMEDTLDSWGNKMGYAVTMSMTNSGTFKPSYGAISIQTEDSVTLVRPQGSAHFVIYSHGRNAAGATYTNGLINVPCDTAVDEGENCDGDAVFTSGLRGIGYDDYIAYQASTPSEPWKANGSSIMYSANDGNVGVSLPANTPPETRLDVGGSVTVVGSVMADSICDEDGNNCWSPALVGGPTGMTCSSLAGDPPNTFRPMIGIAGGGAACNPVPIPRPAPYAAQPCPPGKFATGITQFGVVDCKEL